MKQNILFVDDDRRRTEIFVEMLRMEGYDVTFAATVKEAESALKKQDSDFHLAILDIMIPQEDYFEKSSHESRTRGIKLLEEIRKVKNKDELPVIILTVCSDQVIRKNALEAGYNEYLEKPCLPSKLLEKVEKYLEIED